MNTRCIPLSAPCKPAVPRAQKPLFCSHMLDLSEETDDENIKTCVDRFTKMQKDGMKQWLEMEIGITGGEEDGVDNSNVDPEKLMTTPAQIHAVYSALSPIAPYFSIAAAFGNVHGVYKPGNVVLNPTILGKHQAYVGEKTGKATPLYLVFHGGSGSTKQEIKTAVSNGVVKMNIDTDTQWAYWTGLRDYFFKNWDSLMLQVGVVSVGGDPDKPNKKKFDPRVWLRAAEETLVARVKLAYEELGAVSTLTLT